MSWGDIMATRQDELEFKYVMGQANEEEMREMFRGMNLPEPEVEFRIALELDRIDLNNPLEVIN